MYGLLSKQYTENIDAYVVEGEILDNIFGGISQVIYKPIYLPTEEKDAISRHGMSAVISGIKKRNAIYENLSRHAYMGEI